MSVGRVALVIDAAKGSRSRERLAPVVAELSARDLRVEFVGHRERTANETRSALRDVDGALVWVDPIPAEGQDRAQLDQALRDVAEDGVWVSAHPDTIDKIGTKAVLHRTRELGWGADTRHYLSLHQFVNEFPTALSGGARVLKPLRGNGGIGVQKVQLVSDSIVRVQGAELRDETADDRPIEAFVEQCAAQFANGGSLVDQPFQPRITEGMIRCYLVESEVVGFSRQYPADAAPGVPDARAQRNIFGLPAAKTMFAPDDSSLAVLRARVETEWVPAMRSALDLDAGALPALWDCDFLLGPRTAAGDDTYVLCEINASSVLPFPPEGPAKLAHATETTLLAR